MLEFLPDAHIVAYIWLQARSKLGKTSTEEHFIL